MPSVRIWDMEDQLHPQIAEMTKGHKFGVACVVCKTNTSIRVVTKISSCRVNTTSRRGIKRLGISCGSIFLLFSNKSSWGPLS